MIEVTKLIQIATDTTKSLFENSGQRKLRFKNSEQKQPEAFANKKPSKKNIKLGDPFKKADH